MHQPQAANQMRYSPHFSAASPSAGLNNDVTMRSRHMMTSPHDVMTSSPTNHVTGKNNKGDMSSMHGQQVEMSLQNAEMTLQQQQMMYNNGGTTYFYHADKKGNSHHQEMLVHNQGPDYRQMNKARQAHVNATLSPQDSRKQGIPAEVGAYVELYPLDGRHGNHANNEFPCRTTSYKAFNRNDGKPYFLRRMHGISKPSENPSVELWKSVDNANVVTLREVFSTKAFGDISTIIVHDFHPTAQTLMERHFTSVAQEQESYLWNYVIQLSVALFNVHTKQLHCRGCVNMNKIIVCDCLRLRISACGTHDAISTESNPQQIKNYQQQDLIKFGQVILCLAHKAPNLNFSQLSNVESLIQRTSCDSDLKKIMTYLLVSPQSKQLQIEAIMPFIGARFISQLDTVTKKSDVHLERALKEAENSKLYRLVCKLGTINERPDKMNKTQSTWADTGDRYMLKLFRDYVFHQQTESGKPFIDLAHITSCLNKLDAGTEEQVMLMSRDSNNLLIVSYHDIKKAMNKCYDELRQLAESD